MLGLASLSRPVRLAVRLLWIAGGGGLALLLVGTLAGDGDARTAAFEACRVGLYLVAAALCFLRAAKVRGERFAWNVFGVGMVASAAGWASYQLVARELATPPHPSLADALWLTGYVGSVVGLLALMRSRVQRLRDSSWIDAAVGGLAGWGWLLFGGIYVFQGVCDTIYLYETANGTFQSHSLLTTVWPACDLLIAIAAWQTPVFSKARHRGAGPRWR